MIYTPVITMDYKLDAVTQTATGPVIEHNLQPSMELNEKVPALLTKSTLEAAAPGEPTIMDQVECLLETDIKPEFQDQFQVAEEP